MQHEENNFISFSLLHTNESVIAEYVESALDKFTVIFQSVHLVHLLPKNS